MPVGRFAPSPSGPLHLGSLRTALLAWLFARSDGSRFLLRIEDLDPVASRPEHAESHRADLRLLGLDWDEETAPQSSRREAHDAALARLVQDGLTYECFCTRREVAEAASAPHVDLPEGAYPGTCRDLTPAARQARRAEGRSPALRLRAGGERVEIEDRLAGPVAATVDDFVLRRRDGVVAYNLAVVVDDHDDGVEEVVRGNDLLPTTPRQVLLARHLGLAVPRHAHVPLVLGPDGVRLAKRHGAVTLADRRALGESPAAVLGRLATSLGLAGPGEAVTPELALGRFVPEALPRGPWVLPSS